jgi:hypothetical protein
VSPVQLAAVVLVASVVSIELGVTVALLELTLGVAAGNVFGRVHCRTAFRMSPGLAFPQPSSLSAGSVHSGGGGEDAASLLGVCLTPRGASRTGLVFPRVISGSKPAPASLYVVAGRWLRQRAAALARAPSV